MARGFGTTRGSASTDRIATALTAHSTTRTYAFWAKVSSYTDFARVFDKLTAAGTSPEQIQYSAANGNFIYIRNRATTNGQWLINAGTISTGTWAHYALTYDAGDVANDPVWYRNGASVGIFELATPSGAVTTNTDVYTWGNRGAADRIFNADLAEMAIWDAILTAAEIASLARGWRADRIRPATLVSYIDAIRDVRDKAGAPTVTGTAVREHPIFIGSGSILLPNKGAGGALNDYELVAEYGAFAESGQDATLLTDRALGADAGSYSLAGQDATLDYVETDPAPVAAPVQVGGGGRSRVYFEVWKNVPLFEAETEQEARKVVKAIKKKLRRQIHRLERGQAPDVALPDVSQIRMTGPDSIVAAMQPQFREVIDLAHAYQRLADEMDEDDVETLLL
jgi:hypothetical protein